MRGTGTLKWLREEKDYSFATPENGANDAFVPRSAIQIQGFETPREGDRVELEIAEGTKGPAAENVTRIV
jgi:cold shock protein